jgi:hypothetical protein
MKNWKYYEVDFFRFWPASGVRPMPYGIENAMEKADADYTMLIKATRKPTIEEAERWLKDAIVNLHESGVLQVVGPVEEAEIAGCYNMDGNENWPIFG